MLRWVSPPRPRKRGFPSSRSISRPSTRCRCAGGSSWPTPCAERAVIPGSGVWCWRRRGAGSTPGWTSRRSRRRGQGALIGANHGCAEAFAAVYDCEVPVVAAVQGFCLGGGIGLAGNADAIVASRRRDLRAAGGGPGRAGRGHASGAAGAAASDARDGLHLAYGDRRRAAALGSVLAGRTRGRTAAPPPWVGRGRSPRRTAGCCGGPRSRSTASTRSTSAAATASSRASPSS